MKLKARPFQDLLARGCERLLLMRVKFLGFVFPTVLVPVAPLLGSPGSPCGLSHDDLHHTRFSHVHSTGLSIHLLDLQLLVCFLFLQAHLHLRTIKAPSTSWSYQCCRKLKCWQIVLWLRRPAKWELHATGSFELDDLKIHFQLHLMFPRCTLRAVILNTLGETILCVEWMRATQVSSPNYHGLD